MSTKSNLVPRPMSSSSREEDDLKRAAARDAARTTDPLLKIRLICLSRGCNGIYMLGKRFRIMDDNKSGFIEMNEFTKGIRELAESISDSQLQELFDTFDKDGNGKITYNEFLRTMRPPMNDLRESLVKLAFEKMDKSDDGLITYKDIKGVYSGAKHPQVLSGVKTEKEVLIKFLHTFESEASSPDVEPSGDGVVTWDEFLDYYSGVSASIDDDPYFDLMMRQAWRL